MLGEFACTENGAWYGQVQSHNGRIARILPLDLPEKIRPGELLRLSGETLEDRLARVAPGTVIDPLGRQIIKIGDVSMGNLNFSTVPQETKGGSFWGLKTLGEFMNLHDGEGVVLLGSPPGGLPLLFSQIAAAQRADFLYIFCQGGYHELYRYCRAVQMAGSAERCMILWTPPWNVPALKNLAPRALTYLSTLPDEGGRRLILIDDLHYWLESVREYGESSGELPLPDGYPYTARRQLGELLDLKSLPDEEGRSTSLLVGWRYEEGFSPLAEHPYMGRLPRFMRTGIILEESSEYLLPSKDSWGELSPAGRCWRELCRLAEECDEALRPVLKALMGLFGSLFVEYSPLSFAAAPENVVQWSDDDGKTLVGLASRATPALLEAVLKIRAELQLSFREWPDVRRRGFIDWVRAQKEERS